MVIRKLALNVLKLLGFVAIFCIYSALDVKRFSEHPLISNDMAIKIAHMLYSNPYPEDIYSIYDFSIIGFNLIVSIITFIILVKLIKKARSK